MQMTDRPALSVAVAICRDSEADWSSAGMQALDERAKAATHAALDAIEQSPYSEFVTIEDFQGPFVGARAKIWFILDPGDVGLPRLSARYPNLLIAADDDMRTGFVRSTGAAQLGHALQEAVNQCCDSDGRAAIRIVVSEWLRLLATPDSCLEAGTDEVTSHNQDDGPAQVLAEALAGRWRVLAEADDDAVRTTGEGLLDTDTRRIADLLAGVSGELAGTKDPPKPLLREIGRWFASKADKFASAFVESAGKTAGPVAVVATGAALSGQVGHLIELANRLAQLGR